MPDFSGMMLWSGHMFLLYLYYIKHPLNTEFISVEVLTSSNRVTSQVPLFGLNRMGFQTLTKTQFLWHLEHLSFIREFSKGIFTMWTLKLYTFPQYKWKSQHS